MVPSGGDSFGGEGSRGSPGWARWIRTKPATNRTRVGGRWSRRFPGRRFGGVLVWTTRRLRVDFNGGLYVADTEDQGVGLDPIMLCPDSESQLGEGDVPDSEDKAIEEDSFVVPETPEEAWPSATVEEQEGEEHAVEEQVVEDRVMEEQNVKRTKAWTSISDAETDDEGISTCEDQSGNVCGNFQKHEDGKLKELVTDMLSTLIPAYGKMVKKTNP